MEIRINETTVVRKFKVAGSNYVVLQAWERSELMGKHSTVAFIDGELYGRIGSNPDSASYADLKPGSDERIKAVKAAYEVVEQRAYDAIIEAFPEVLSSANYDTRRFRNGEVEIIG